MTDPRAALAELGLVALADVQERADPALIERLLAERGVLLERKEIREALQHIADRTALATQTETCGCTEIAVAALSGEVTE